MADGLRRKATAAAAQYATTKAAARLTPPRMLLPRFAYMRLALPSPPSSPTGPPAQRRFWPDHVALRARGLPGRGRKNTPPAPPVRPHSHSRRSARRASAAAPRRTRCPLSRRLLAFG